ncbi:MAG: bifunctional oligoribonuclease/PAP phosphatase NrnA [Verrucomicrobiota bacterium]
MNSNCTLAQVGAVLREHQRFLVVSHFRPDGDAIGCSLAMGLCLQKLGKDVTVWNEDGLPERFDFLPGASLVTSSPEAPVAFDVVVVVDTAVRERVGARTLGAIAPGALWLNVDHHVSNDRKGDLVYVDTSAPAAGQILFELFEQCALPLGREIAEALYVAISTDTGSFQYPSTTARTYEIAAALVREGVPVGSINQSLYENCPRRRIELQRALYDVLRFDFGDRVASFALTQAVATQVGAIPDDTEGLIESIRRVEGVVVAVFFEELNADMVRISMRSKDVRMDVCKICGEFGGGGHILAAGARIAGTLSVVQERVLSAIARHLEALPAL